MSESGDHRETDIVVAHGLSVYPSIGIDWQPFPDVHEDQDPTRSTSAALK